MLFRGRQFFARVGRFEVYVRGATEGEPLMGALRSVTQVSSDVVLWLPGVHLVVSRLNSGNPRS